MEKLLQWSTAQESSDPTVRASVAAPDPKLLAQVLGVDTGKDDVTLMKEDISVLVCDDKQITIDDKLTALEDFEILIQNLDNANNMLAMGIWPEIIKLYTYSGEEEEEFKGLGALITGTAVQNNPKCQDDFYKVAGDQGVEQLLQLVKNLNNFNVRSRALYALSGLLAHNGKLYESFIKSKGWAILSSVLSETFKNERNDNKVLLRSLNLFKNLLFDEIIQEGETELFPKNDRFKTIQDSNLLIPILNKLSAEAHIDVNDRILSILSYVLKNGYSFNADELKLLNEKLPSMNSIKDKLNQEDIATITMAL